MNTACSRSVDRRFFRRSALLVAVLTGIVLFSGCASNKSRDEDPRAPVDNPFKPRDEGPGSRPSHAAEREKQLKADQLYRRGHKELLNAEYTNAAKTFDDLITRYPFTPYATQAQIEQVYAQYRSYNTEAAAAGADRFLREHPRHPHADYVLYLRGLIDQSRDQSLLQYLPINPAEHDPNDKQHAFQDFALLLQRYPNSRYNWDARQRMVSLRNDIAVHELSIARFYMKRGAWLAAAKRAQNVIANYPGAPATADALLDLKRCYTQLGLKDQEQQVDTLIAANQKSLKAARSPTVVRMSTQDAPPPPPPGDDSAAAGASASASTATTASDEKLGVGQQATDASQSERAAYGSIPASEAHSTHFTLGGASSTSTSSTAAAGTPSPAASAAPATQPAPVHSAASASTSPAAANGTTPASPAPGDLSDPSQTERQAYAPVQHSHSGFFSRLLSVFGGGDDDTTRSGGKASSDATKSAPASAASSAR